MLSSTKIWMLTIFLWLFGGLSVCWAQESSMSIYTIKGKLISKGSNTNPVGELKVTTYRLEQIELTKPFDMRDGKPPIETAFRLVLKTKQPLPLGDFSIWLDDFQHYAFQTQPNAFAIVIYARTLPDGKVKLALSKRGENDLASRSVSPEILTVPSDYATPSEEIEANRPIIKLRRLPNRNTFIELKIEIPGTKCVMADIPFIIEVNGQAFSTFCEGDAMFAILSSEEFAQLRNGAEISVKLGKSTNRRIVGYLDKNSLQ